MVSAGRDELLCDLAETYHIYDFKALPARTLATLSVGLRDNSRIKMLMRGEKVSAQDAMMAAAVDRLTLLVWMQTEDGVQGINRPPSLLEQLLGEPNSTGEVVGFETTEDFERAWEALTGVKHG